jgi:hypothetical protein
MKEMNLFLWSAKKTWNTFPLIVPLKESITKVLIGKTAPEK